MRIEKVLRKDENNVIIYFDNSQKLILSEDVFYQSGLRKGDEVSDDRFSFFVEQNILYYIKQKALSFLSRRFHSEKEVLLKLKQKSYDEKLIKIVLGDLKAKGFIDDRVFASHFVEEKLNKKRWGRNKIKSTLYSKGVNSKIINEVLSNLSENESDVNLASELAVKKLNQLRNRNIDELKLRQKLTTFLISRGFDYETCREVCNKLLKDDFNYSV